MNMGLAKRMFLESWMSLAMLLCLSLTMVVRQCQADGSYGQLDHAVGINYGTLGDNLPSPTAAVAAIKAMQAGRVKLFNPNAGILTALANSGMEVVVTVPNEEIIAVGASPAAGDSWIQQNIAPYYPATNIVVILVGNEIFTGTAFQSTWASLVPAVQNLQASLVTRGWSGQIKVSTAVALDVLATSFPPSTGTFRADIATTVMQPLLSFLTTTSSYLFVNVYPFLTYTTNTDISLAYAMFASTATTDVVDGGLVYTNLMDAQLDAVNAAAARLGFAGLRLSVGETGWPSAGDANQPGATIDNAATYNRRLVSKIMSTSQVGTPAKPGVVIPTYIFALFNENQKPGAASERNWGLLYPNLSPVYAIDLTGKTAASEYSPTVESPILATPPLSAGSGTWCVSNAAADPTTLENALNFACGVNAEFCAAIQSGQSCYVPNTVAGHASWALNNYWQNYKGAGGSCSFDGAGVLTSTDPSFGACVFPH
ncbi:hypothetical protein M758_1G230500 [Ceratodon purpureus]|nr:hypothetical protein M758_1G230500 [Ceratodon purpureus]